MKDTYRRTSFSSGSEIQNRLNIYTMYNSTPQTIAQADVDAVSTQLDDLITAIKALNTTNTALTEKERSSGVTVSVKRKPFNDYYYGNKDVAANAAFKPSQTLIPEADAVKHFVVHNQMTALIAKLDTAKELLLDMELNSEHFSFDFAVSGLKAAEEARKKGLPGADSWCNALKALFPKLGRPKQGHPIIN